MPIYRAEVDGIEVFATTTATYEGLAPFPAFLLDRPTAGTVALFVDQECIARNTPKEH